VSYPVRVPEPAVGELGKLPSSARERVRQRIGALADNPRPQGAKKLGSAEDLWRVRVGDYRVLYAIRDRQLLVLVVRVGDRRHVYDRLRRLAREAKGDA